MKIEQKGNYIIANIEGDVDHCNAYDIKKLIDNKIRTSDAQNLIFDFSKLEFMDSSGIGMVLGRYKIIRALGGKVFIAGANKSVQKIINISGLHKIIPEYESIESALGKLCEVRN